MKILIKYLLIPSLFLPAISHAEETRLLRQPSISEDQIALIEYAQSRIKSKRRLFFHFSLMIISIISLLTSNLIFEFKKEIVLFNYPWSYWICSVWFVLFLFHAL